MSDGGFSMMDLFREEVRAHAAALSDGLLRLEADSADAARLEPLMRAAHSIKGAARIVGVDPAVKLAHAMEEVFVAAGRGELRLGPADVDLLLRGTDVLAGLAKLEGDDAGAWVAQNVAAVEQLSGALRALPDRRDGETPAPPPHPRPLSPSGGEGSNDSPLPPKGGEGLGVRGEEISLETAAEPAAAAESVVRVTAQNLTRLMGLAGESLVQARRLAPFTAALHKLKKRQDRLAALLDELGQRRDGDAAELLAEARRQMARCRQELAERIADFDDHAARAEDQGARLYHEVLGSRMRPFADGAAAFPRMVRDLARRLGKQARLEVVGATTEVDRDVLDRLESPLAHLLRNAIDHGLEAPDERRARGKPEAGTLRLEARHRAGTLLVTVEDDGRGVDLERLRAKIVERGLSRPELVAAMSEAELLSFLFLPGFSTAEQVTEFSGRGVGLDVVHDTVRQIGGSVQVTTRPGRGTAFHLRLPVTLSVLRAVLVEVGGEVYAFPHNRIDRLLRVPRSGLDSLEDRQFLAVDGRNVGVVLAAQLFDLPPRPPAGDELAVLLVSDDAGSYGLIVDAFRGEQDLVVRPLDGRLGKVPNVSAAALLDDGAPVLIADVEDLVRSLGRLVQGGTLTRCEPAAAGAARRKRVLVVEDSITVREVERQILRTRGYDVTTAVDGQDGWNFARTQPFDLIITDVDMPRMDGLALLRAVRASPSLKDVPVVIVSYKDREEDRLRGLEAGANHYLTKGSFHDNTFVQAVADLIGEP